MNMGGTFRAKVLQYKPDGNTLTEKWETLTKLVDGVYYTKDRDNWDNVRYAFIFEDNGVFWYSLRAATENQFSNPNERERIINLRNNFRTYVKETAQNNGFIRSLEIEVFKRLGEDTAPLYASREAYLKNREEEERKRAEEAERRERERREAEERRKAEVLADGKEKLLKHECITVEQIELIAETVGYKIHIRTIGFMREKVTEAVLREDDTVTVWGRKLTSRNIDGTANVLRELCDRLKAQVEAEARQPAQGTETPQISTQTAEVTNVSTEDGKREETQEIGREPEGREAVCRLAPAWAAKKTLKYGYKLYCFNLYPNGEFSISVENRNGCRILTKDEFRNLCSEPPQPPEAPQAVECATDTPKPRETAGKRQNRGIGNTRHSGLGANGYAMLDNASATLAAMSVPRECPTAEAVYW